MDEVRVVIDLTNIRTQAGGILNVTLGSLKEVMAEEGLSEDQVKRIFDKWADRMLAKKNEMVGEASD